MLFEGETEEVVWKGKVRQNERFAGKVWDIVEGTKRNWGLVLWGKLLGEN